MFGPVLLEATGVRHDERASVEAALASLYDSIALEEDGHAPDRLPPHQAWRPGRGGGQRAAIG